MLTAYITYARDHINPRITEEAHKALVSSYVAMRKLGEDPRSSERRITATTRQLESLIRLGEAHARMRFSPFVESSDVDEATRLMHEAIRTSATDPLTGKIDIDLLNTGSGQQQRRLRADLKREISAMVGALGAGRSLRWIDAIKQIGEQSDMRVDATEFSDVVKELEGENILKVTGERDRRVIRKVVGM
jgi:DNA replication licensing factor MCM4